MATLSQWLESLGLAAYTKVFVDNDVDLELLPSLSEQDLEKLGLTMGHRKRLLKAAAALGGDSAELHRPDSAAYPLVPQRESGGSGSGERRQLTVLFCDMVGFTELATSVDPEILRGVIRAYEDACAACVTRYDGFVFQRLGDGIVAFFGYPIAHEGEAERAILAALAIVEAMSTLVVGERDHLSVRIGIDTGLVVVSPADRSAVGETMNIASRLQAIAPVGGIAVSERVFQLASGRFVYNSIGSRELKGIPRATAVYLVERESEASSRFDAASSKGLTAMVGREQEIGLLRNRWRLAQDGEGQVVLLSGVPGIGKSRILNVLRKELEADGASALCFQCSPYYTNSALYPSIDNFERALKFGRDDTAEAKLDKVESLLVSHYGRPIEDVRYIAALLSIPFEARYGAAEMTPQRFKDETLRCLADLADAAACRQPTVMLFEDVHWADPTSIEMLDVLIERAKRTPILLLVSHRPEFQPKWIDQEHVAALHLSNLTRGQSSALVNGLTGGKTLPGELLDRILAKTEGVPLYVEELTKSILESGQLKDDGNSLALVGGVQNISIPASLRDSLMSRLDRFMPVKEIAQIGSVIGREFKHELIRSVADWSEADVAPALQQLIDSGLAFRRGTPPDATYVFKHSLVQDAAYDSLLKSRRQELHAKIARVLERGLSGINEAEPELLAHHFGAAGQIEAAVGYWLKASMRAASRSSYQEVLGQLDAASALLASVPPSTGTSLLRLRVQLQRAGALVATKGYFASETGTAWRQAKLLCDESGEYANEAFSVLSGLSAFHLTRGELVEAVETAEELLRRARARNQAAVLLGAHRTVAVALINQGALVEACDHFDQALGLYDPDHVKKMKSMSGSDSKAQCLAYKSHALHLRGNFDQALAANNDAVRLVEATGHAYGVTHILWWVLLLALLRREPHRALTEARRAIELADRHGFSMWHDTSTFAYGVALIDLGEVQQGVEVVEAFLHRCRSMHFGMNQTWTLATLANAEVKLERWEVATQRFDDALATVRSSGERWMEPEIYRLMGEAALARRGIAGSGEAEQFFARSLAVAREQGAKAWELRTATSLARLWHSQGKRQVAVEMLEPVMSWFSEGFGMPDVQDASAVLAALRPGGSDTGLGL